MRPPASCWSCRCGGRHDRVAGPPALDDAAALRRDGRGGDRRGPDARQHRHQPGPRLRSVGAVDRERGRADLLRRPPAAGAGRGPGRRGAGRLGRGAAGTAPQPAGHAVHAGRVGGCGPGCHAGHRLRPRPGRTGRLVGADRQLPRVDGGDGHRLLAGQQPAPGTLDQRAAARRGHAQFLLLGADPVRPVPGRLHPVVPRRCAG